MTADLGASGLSDFWIFDCERWAEHFPPGVSGKTGGPMTYDSANNVLRQYKLTDGFSNHVLIHMESTAPVIRAQPQNATVTAGQPV